MSSQRRLSSEKAVRMVLRPFATMPPLSAGMTTAVTAAPARLRRMSSTQTALVTGGAGFIGSYLCEQLLDEGWEVWALDDLSTGSQENVAHLRGRPGFHLVVDSVLSLPVVNELVHRSDVVYHLAAAVGVRLIVE